MATEHLDVLIVGAGLSGVAAAYYLQTRCPRKRYAILEARDEIGGTWDLFRYPGVRSDSDMHTLGYSFRPWPERKAIADGPAIRTYVRETAAAFGIDRNIRFQRHVRRIAWSTDEARWTVDVEQGPEREPGQLTCSFLFMCTGYYEYDHGYLPEWPDFARYEGRVVHPQAWPPDLDYAGKRVVVIGSGATAVTLVPALAERAASIVMLQRSPTYIVSRPSVDVISDWLRRRLPIRMADQMTRWKNIALGMYFYWLTRRRPERVRATLLQLTREQLGPEYDGVERDFSPRYNPWDQRLCLAPDGDFYNAIRAGKASVVTDEIAAFTARGVRLASGRELPADIIVTATGLRMRLMAGVEILVDGEVVDLARTLAYKGAMFSGVPNLALAIGYTNASWTLKCELIGGYVCRLLNYMDLHGYAACVAPRPADVANDELAMTLTSGYVERARAWLPRQGTRWPWRAVNNYAKDVMILKLGAVNDGVMRFSRAERPARVGVLGSMDKK
ncbi:MAG TPA: NAD(P)/FAD-dependent oxidoreductase [Ktedonobacterales bacterium]